MMSNPELHLLKQNKTGKQSHRNCIVHYPHCKDKNVKPLSSKAFDSIKKAQEIRSLSQNPFHRIQTISDNVPQNYDKDCHGIHTFCFKSFINVSKIKSLLDRSISSPANSNHSPRKTRRLKPSSSISTCSSVLFPANHCLFCEKGPTKKKGRFVGFTKCETLEAAERIRECAEKKKDFRLLGKITGVDLVAREARFHEYCRKSYVADVKRHLKTSSPEEQYTSREQRQAYSEAFQYICKYVRENIFDYGSVVRMVTLRELYLNHVQTNSPEFYNTDHKMQKLKEKLQRQFGDRIKFWKPNNKGELVYSADVPTGAAVEAAFESATSESQILRDAALILRRTILKEQSTSPEISWPPSAEFLSSNLTAPPTCLTEFVSTVLTGSEESRSERTTRIALSVSEDICVAATNGQWKMPKHLLLGITVRHLTGSAQVVTLLNRFGHCSSYHQLLSLENAMAIQTTTRDDILPYNISLENNKIINCCFDNFDLLEETPTGAGTTHSTHGIMIQELQANCVPNVIEATASVPKKQKLHFTDNPLPNYYCKKRVEPTSLATIDGTGAQSTQSSLNPDECVWTICRARFNTECIVPDWNGWLSLTATVPVSRLSIIGFMAPILQPITESRTVHHCIQMSRQAAAKVKQQYSFITMDLAAAKIAYEIKWNSPEEFSDVFIHLGGFHIMCSYMGSLGKMMSGSGFEDILVESGICANGSINQVLSGKHYNRAIRVHTLMLDACERLLLQLFLDQPEGITLPISIKDMTENICNKNLEGLLDDVDYQVFVTRYNAFRDKVRGGEYGSTPQFWLTYVDNVWHLLRFHQAIKTNNLDLYMESMYEMLALLFAADHLHYARYLPLYYFQLKNISQTHPGAEVLLRECGISVARSTVPGCRNAIDLTIEQTMNRSAKTSGGIIGYSRNVSAYYRWCLSRHARSCYVQATFARADIATENSDGHKNTRPSEMRRSEAAVQKILSTFQQFRSPFDVGNFETNVLYCISSGQPAPDKVKTDMLHYVSDGRKAADDFIRTRLVEKSVKFHDTIKKQSHATFKTMAVRKSLTSSQKKTMEIKAERNLLGRLLCLCQTNDISLEKLFAYPLGPIPWALALADGGMVKTNKAQLLHYLESLAVESSSTSPQPETAVYIIDGNAMLQACVNLPETFEDFALQIFKQLPRWSSVHFVTDSYQQNSIKGFERNRRGNSATFTVGGPRTKMPRDFKSFMSNDVNKKQLIRMLLSEWRNNKYAHIMHGRRIYFVREEDCHCLYSLDNIEQQSELVKPLCSDQEEADTRIILHSLHVSSNECPSSIVVRSPDTDVLVIMLYYSASVTQPFYLDTGTGNKRRMIDVKAIASALGPDICAALPAYHAMTGCDHTSAFVRRGKVKPLKLLQKCLGHVSTMKGLGESASVSSELTGGVEHFVCCMYGDNTCDVNYLRHKLFLTRYDCKSESTAFKIPDGVDLSMLPPCRSSLELHILRANYVSLTWKSSHIAFPNLPSPVGLGWQLIDGAIAIQWTKGDVLPQQLVDVLSSNPESPEIDVVDSEDEEHYDVDSFVDVVFSDDEEEM